MIREPDAFEPFLAVLGKNVESQTDGFRPTETRPPALKRIDGITNPLAVILRIIGVKDAEEMQSHHVVLHDRDDDDLHDAAVVQRGEPVLRLLQMVAHVDKMLRIKVTAHPGHRP